MATTSPLIVPLNPVPAQTLNISLGTPTQAFTLNIYAKEIQVPILEPGQIVSDPPVFETIEPLFMDVYLAGTLVVGGVLCLNNNLVIKNLYFGVQGDFAFYDAEGAEDPQYSGLGSRFFLLYWPSLP